MDKPFKREDFRIRGLSLRNRISERQLRKIQQSGAEAEARDFVNRLIAIEKKRKSSRGNEHL